MKSLTKDFLKRELSKAIKARDAYHVKFLDERKISEKLRNQLIDTSRWCNEYRQAALALRRGGSK